MKRQRLLVMGILLLALLPSALTHGQTGVAVRENRVTVTFPRSITYHLEIAGDNKIATAGLRYGTDGQNCQPTGAYQPVEVAGDGNRFSWTWDLARYGTLPAATELWWQWELIDQAGNRFTTRRETAQLVDDNFTFREMSRDGVIVYWVEGDASFATYLLDLTQQSLSQLERNFGVQASRPVKIIVYPSSEALRAALIHVPDWIGGVALAAHNTIVAGIPPDAYTWAEEVLRHELGHLVVGAATFNCLGRDVPAWLREGLAVYAEGPLSAPDKELVTAALAGNSLPRLRSQADGFSSYSQATELAYAQSAAVVRYLLERFGAQQMGSLLSAMQTGQSVDDALRTTYGFDTDGLDSAWRQSLGYEALPTRPAVTVTPTAVPTLPPLVIAFPTAEPTSFPSATASTPTPTLSSTLPAEIAEPTLTLKKPTAVALVAADSAASPESARARPSPESSTSAATGAPAWPWLLYGMLALGTLTTIALLSKQIRHRPAAAESTDHRN